MGKNKEQLEYYVEHTSAPVFAGMHILDDLFDHEGIARYVNENGDAEIIVFPNQKWVKSKFDDNHHAIDVLWSDGYHYTKTFDENGKAVIKSEPACENVHQNADSYQVADYKFAKDTFKPIPGLEPDFGFGDMIKNEK